MFLSENPKCCRVDVSKPVAERNVVLVVCEEGPSSELETLVILYIEKIAAAD